MNGLSFESKKNGNDLRLLHHHHQDEKPEMAPGVVVSGRKERV